MFADDWGRQPTLDAFTDSGDAVREASEVRNDLATLTTTAAMELAAIERVIEGEPAYTLNEWLALPTDEQADAIPERISGLTDAVRSMLDGFVREDEIEDLLDDLHDEVTADPEPLAPTDYPGRRPETDDTGREFR